MQEGEPKAMHHVMQRQIVEELHVKSTIVPAAEIQIRVRFLQDYLSHAGLHALVLGISGGQDSSLTGRLCQLAVEDLRRATGKNYTFIALRLPYGVQRDEGDAQRALQFIRPDQVYTVDIKPAVDAAVAQLEACTGMPMSDYNRGNQKAQERMSAQYRIAHQYKGLVVGTDHAAEAVMGFFTKYGDGGVDVAPLAGLTKRQGRAILQWLGAPEEIYQKPPTADLLDELPGRLDEEELGISYHDIDRYLEGEAVHAAAARRIEARYRMTAHKRHLPVTPFDDWWRVGGIGESDG